MEEKDLFASMAKAIVEAEGKALVRLVQTALAQSISPLRIISEGIRPGLDDVGQRFSQCDFFIPELIMAAEAVKGGLAMVNETIAKSGAMREYVGHLMICSVEGDVHNIGKDIIVSLANVRGFQVTDLGVDVPDQKIVQKVAELEPDVLGLSALMTTTMIKQRGVIEALQEAGLREHVKVLVGGAPVTPEWANQIGADGTAADAVGAVEMCQRIMEGKGRRL